MISRPRYFSLKHWGIYLLTDLVLTPRVRMKTQWVAKALLGRSLWAKTRARTGATDRSRG